jgi:hypothetical protein
MVAIDRIELVEQRLRVETDAVDRSGRRHRVVLHRAAGVVGSELSPSIEYLERMVAGSRHWELPIGWIVGLDDRLAATAEAADQNRAFRP